MKLRSLIPALFTAMLCLFVGASISADTIYLRGGGRVFGKIVNQDRTSVRVRTARGMRTIAKKSIRRVQYGDPAADARRRRAYLKRRREAREKKKQERLAAEKKRREIAAAAAAKSRRDAERKRVVSDQGFDWNNRLGSAWRSAVLPGWGHYDRGDTLFAYIYGGLFLGAVAHAGSAGARASAAQSEYQSTLTRNLILAGPVLDDLEANNKVPTILASLLLNTGASSSYEASTDRANSALGLVGLVYLAQIVHAFIVGGGRGDSPTRVGNAAHGDWRIAVLPPRENERGAGMALEFRF